MPLFTNRPRHLNDDSQNAPRSLFSKLRQWLYFRRGGDPTASWNSEDFFPRRDISHTSLRTRKSSCRLTTTRNRDEVPTDGVPYYSYPQNLAAVPNGRGVHRDQRHYTPPDNRHLYQFDALSRKPDNPYPYQYTAPASMLPSVPPSQEGQSGTPHIVSLNTFNRWHIRSSVVICLILTLLDVRLMQNIAYNERRLEILGIHRLDAHLHPLRTIFSQEGIKTNDNAPSPKQLSVLRVIFALVLLRLVICVVHFTLSFPNLSLLFFVIPLLTG